MEKIVRLNAFIQSTRGGKLYLNGREVMCVALTRGCTFTDGPEDEITLTDEQLEELLGQTYGKPPAVPPRDENGIQIGDSVKIEATGIVESFHESGYLVRLHGVLVPMLKSAVTRVEEKRG